MRVCIFKQTSCYILYYVFWKTRVDRLVFYGADWKSCSNTMSFERTIFTHQILKDERYLRTYEVWE